MGVPALFRWLSRKYPKIVTHVAEDKPSRMVDGDGTEIIVPVDITTPNPNGFEMDNLYLDMNGIVHPCTHPEGKPAPATEQDMMLEIFTYTERIVNMIRPRKLLFMAIDGVAPRAKMNQQRSRRFRAAQEAKEKEEQRLEQIALFEAMGKVVSDETKNAKTWDSNAITPGTPFMDLLAESLRYWVIKKLNTDPGWSNLEVIISDASVPGEGEHKIMDFIRRQRISPTHDPNTKHVIYGLDADLIMLALATHEPHFRVLREDVFAQDKSTACRNCGQEGHFAAQCTVDKTALKEPVDKIEKPLADSKPFIFLDVSILREYLEIELDVSAPFQFDFERAIDDWVLLIFFVGNDFLPHLPSLEIREGAIDMLVGIWKRELHTMRGYLTNHGTIELRRAQIILNALARREDEIFRRRREVEERQDQAAKRRKIEQASNISIGIREPEMPIPSGAEPQTVSSAGLTPTPESTEPARHMEPDEIRRANLSALKALKGIFSPSVVDMEVVLEKDSSNGPEVSKFVDMDSGPRDPSTDEMDRLTEVSPTSKQDHTSVGELPILEVQQPLDKVDMKAEPREELVEATRGIKRKLEAMEEDDAIETASEEEASTSKLALKVNADGSVEQVDTVRLWEPGYRERYYRQKFNADINDAEFRRRIVKHYVEGLAWVLQYYYQGTPSWTWYYPYHFAPFAADFEGIEDLDIKFDKGVPFQPFEQLMGVFPPASRHHLPLPLQDLMTNPDSPIIDFYPTTFDIDMNGKRMAWQGVALLPFIDEARLLDAIRPLYPLLTADEQRRNSWGNNNLFVGDKHRLFDSIAFLYGRQRNSEGKMLDPSLSYGLSGSIRPDPHYIPGATYSSPLTHVGLDDIQGNSSITALYLYPPQTIPHRSRLLARVSIPRRVLSSADYEFVQRSGRGKNDGFRGTDSQRHSPYPGQEPRGYVHNYSNSSRGRGFGQNGNNDWRARNARGEPDYSYGAGTPNGYRGLPPRGVGRGRGQGWR